MDARAFDDPREKHVVNSKEIYLYRDEHHEWPEARSRRHLTRTQLEQLAAAEIAVNDPTAFESNEFPEQHQQ